MNRQSHLSKCAVVVATAYRPSFVRGLLASLAKQSYLPTQTVIADGSKGDHSTLNVVEEMKASLPYEVIHHACLSCGSARQRNEGAELVREPVIVFMDDDVEPEPDCLRQMMLPFAEDRARSLGGVGATIVNQCYREPSPLFKRWLDFLADEPAPSYAGRVIGPAVNIWPAMGDGISVLPVEWLASTCVAYRRTAFEREKFSEDFTGYSMGEDVHLSLRVGKAFRLAVATAARVYHNTQPSRFKTPFSISRMSVESRYRIMNEVLGKRGAKDRLKLLMLVVMDTLSQLRNTRSAGDVVRFVMCSLGSAVGLASIGLGAAGLGRQQTSAQQNV